MSNLTEEQKEYIEENYKLGKEKLAETLSVPYKYVDNHFSFSLYRNPKVKEWLYGEIYKLADTGMTKNDIGDRLNISRTTVKNVLIKRKATEPLNREENTVYSFIKKCAKEAKNNIIDLKLEKCNDIEILAALENKNLVKVLPIEKEKYKRIVLTEAQ